MTISSKYIVVEKLEEEINEGFKTVEVQDNFVYKGRVSNLPEVPVFVDNHRLLLGDVILFAKYSPDSHEIEENGKKLKFVNTNDLLAVV